MGVSRAGAVVALGVPRPVGSHKLSLELLTLIPARRPESWFDRSLSSTLQDSRDSFHRIALNKADETKLVAG